jgi:acetate kinase
LSTAPDEAIAVVDAGSSSLKFSLFQQRDGDLHCTARGKVEGLGAAPHFIAKDAAGQVLAERRWPGHASAPRTAAVRPGSSRPTRS